MIADVLLFLRKHLDDRLRVAFGGSQDEVTERVVFLDGDRVERVSFLLNAVTMLLINVEEDRILRNPDLYARRAEDGTVQRVQPDVRLILYVLFVARFKQYESAWKHLSQILEHFQTVRVIESTNSPDLPAGLDRLSIDLITLGFAEQNEIWNALRTTHHPSLLYRVKLLAFRDRQPAELPEVVEVGTDLGRVT